MTRGGLARAAFATAVVGLAVVAGSRAFEKRSIDPAPQKSPAIASSSVPAAPETYRGFLYGRVTTLVGNTYEGRLRWGRGEEAFWGDAFNGAKDGNPWVAHVPPERLPRERRPIEIFGFKIASREREVDLGRLFMARFGDIARIEARGISVVRVTLKSGSVFDLDRNSASDFDDDVRVWDGTRGVVDLDSRGIRAIDLLPTAALRDVPRRLHGTVRTKHGDFTGFFQWNREKCVGSDELVGRTAGSERRLRFDTLRSIARRSGDGALVTLLDGREIELSDTPEVGRGNRGVYVDDRRYGRVLISWDAFERVDFSTRDSGPAYGDFPPGRPLTGGVTTRDGRRLTGRLVYDLDESETTETLDAPSQGIDYSIPFGLVAAIAQQRGAERVRVSLGSGEELQLARAGDFAERNGGMLIFVDGQERPEYVPWSDVERIDFERAPAMYPPARAPYPARSPASIRVSTACAASKSMRKRHLLSSSASGDSRAGSAEASRSASSLAAMLLDATCAASRSRICRTSSSCAGVGSSGVSAAGSSASALLRCLATRASDRRTSSAAASTPASAAPGVPASSARSASPAASARRRAPRVAAVPFNRWSSAARISRCPSSRSARRRAGSGSSSSRKCSRPCR